MDDLDDILTAVGSSFLGLTVNCARCHDHKFDPILQRDYYALQAVFAGVQHADREIPRADSAEDRRRVQSLRAELAEVEQGLDVLEPIADPARDQASRRRVNPRRNVDRFAPTRALGVRLTILATNDGTEPCIDELEVWSAGATSSNVALAEKEGKAAASSDAFPGSPIHRVEHLNDGKVGNGRSWIAKGRGKGWAKVTWPKPTLVDRIVWGRDRDGAYIDRLATQYFVELEVELGVWSVVASSLDRIPIDAPADLDDSSADPETTSRRLTLNERRKAIRDELAERAAALKVYAGRFEPPDVTHRLERGDPMRRAEPVGPGTLGVLKPALKMRPDAPDPERRLALARWLGDPENPLPARVMVNRVWMHHFGRGLLATPGDFGFQGGEPSHPELLDWLADQYRRAGFRLKPLHRLIVTSSAYRQGGRLAPKAEAIDRDNRLLWRKSPRRLEAESLRDAILAVSGSLDRRVGGPGYTLWEKNTNYVVVFTPMAKLGPETFRRMVYQFKPRSQADPTFGAFDYPDAALVAPRRNVSTTALQALNLLNSPFLIDQAARFAARIEREAARNPGAQVERAFLLAFGRSPHPRESEAALRVVREAGLPALARALYNSNEFIQIP